MTVKGKKKLDSELKKLVGTERPAVIQAIEVARAHGDLSENAEYSAARERQSFVEGRIAEINGKLADAEVIDPSKITEAKIVFGATVTLLNLDNDEEKRYQIVGEDEADVSSGSISVMSPLARALIGKREGDVFDLKIPKGEVEYEILKIEYI